MTLFELEKKYTHTERAVKDLIFLIFIIEHLISTFRNEKIPIFHQ